MYFTFIVMMLLGSSMAIAFVLQPSKEEPAASVTHHRCQGESLQSIRKSLLRALNLQVEPHLPAGELEGVRAKLKNTFNGTAQGVQDAAVPAFPGYSVSPDDGNSTNPKCCSMASEVFMKDLGWDSWVIHPLSLTIVQCALCNPAVNPVQCPPSHTNVQDANSQVPCCHPTSEEMVQVVYMDRSSTIIISFMQLTRSCGCEHENIQQPSEE